MINVANADMHNISTAEGRVVSAIKKLLDGQPKRGTFMATMFGSRLPGRLSVTFHEFFEAYGLRVGANRQYDKDERAEAMSALLAFAAPRWQITHAGVDTSKAYSTNSKATLITIAYMYDGLSFDEHGIVSGGTELPEKQVGFLIDCHPAMMDYIRQCE